MASIVKTLEEFGAMDYTTLVVSTASDLAPLQYIAPYAGCAIGEEWMENGEDVLVSTTTSVSMRRLPYPVPAFKETAGT